MKNNKHFVLFVGIITFVGGTTQAALSVIDISTSGVINATNSATFAHDVSGANTVVFVTTVCEDPTEADRDVSSVTYNADALAEIREDDSGIHRAETTIWFRVAPDAGTYNVVVTWAGDVAAGGAGAITFAGADQTNPVDADHGETPAENPISTSITNQTNNAYVIDAISSSCDNSPNSHASDASQTDIFNIELGASRDGGSSYKGPISPAAATAMIWTQDNNVEGSAHSLVAVKPVVVPTGGQVIMITSLPWILSIPLLYGIVYLRTKYKEAA